MGSIQPFADEFISVKDAIIATQLKSKTDLDRLVIQNNMPIIKGSSKWEYLIHLESLKAAYFKNRTITMKRSRPRKALSTEAREWKSLHGHILPLWRKIWTKDKAGRTIHNATFKKLSKQKQTELMANHEVAVQTADAAKKKMKTAAKRAADKAARS